MEAVLVHQTSIVSMAAIESERLEMKYMGSASFPVVEDTIFIYSLWSIQLSLI